MAKANNIDIYPYDTNVSVFDYLLGTDINDSKRNKNYRIIDILALANANSQGSAFVQYFFSDASSPDSDYFTPGMLFTDNNETIPGDFSKLIFNKTTNSGLELGSLFSFFGRTPNMVLKIENATDPNNFFNFKVTGYTEEDEYVVFDVEPLNDLFIGSLINGSICSISWDVIQSIVFTTDFPYNLSSGKSLGKLSGQGVYPTIGLTQEEFLREIALEYINPTFTSFTIAGQPTTVEVGTILSGNKTFNWGITLNSGIVPTIDIYDNTAGTTLLAATANDGTETQSITSIQLDSNGATQSWKAIGNNDNGANINSGNFAVTSLFNRYWGEVATLPASSADGTANRVYANLLSKAVKTNGTNTFTLVTGTTSNKFIVLLPPGVTITSVIDTGNLNLNITSSYIQSTITIKDAGGTDRVYNQYLFNPAGTYPVSTNHVITTN